MAAAHGRPRLMQDVLAPLVEIERLQARMDDAVLIIQQLYDDTPLQNHAVRLALHQSMVQLGDANRELERQKLFHYLNIVADVQACLQAAGRLPVVRHEEGAPDF